MNITVAEAELNELLGKAILESLSQDSRDQIITAAVKHLNEPSSGYGSDRKTPLQRAFDQGVERLTHSLIEDVLKESDHYQQVRSEVAALIAQFPSVESDPELKPKIVTLILEHVAEAQRKLDRERDDY